MKPVVKSVIEPISVPEMREVERSIVKYVQVKHFKEEIECLHRNQDVVIVLPRQRPKGGSVKRGSSIYIYIYIYIIYLQNSIRTSSSMFGLDPVLGYGILVVGG